MIGLGALMKSPNLRAERGLPFLILASMLGCAAPDHGLQGNHHPSAILPIAQMVEGYIPPPSMCPNWESALKTVQEAVGCDHEPASKCLQKVSECSRGCDLCAILQDGRGPVALSRDMGRGTLGCTERPWDLRTCPGWGNWSSSWKALFGKAICTDATRVNDLAKTMIHEGVHACPSTGGAPIPADPPGGSTCDAYDIADTCMERP
jgi:hypothetical protein